MQSDDIAYGSWRVFTPLRLHNPLLISVADTLAPASFLESGYAPVNVEGGRRDIYIASRVGAIVVQNNLRGNIAMADCAENYQVLGNQVSLPVGIQYINPRLMHK